MTKTCVVCKKYPVSGDNTRSFYKFPLNKDIKKLWMDATGVTKVTANCTVCSDHFTATSFQQTDGFGAMKRLLRNAIPVVGRDEDNKTKTILNESDGLKNVTHEERDNTQRTMGIGLDVTNENESRVNTLDMFDGPNYSNDSSTQSADEEIDMDNMSNKEEQKLSTTNIRALNIKRMFRFRDGEETKYICRDEFVTEEAWEKFLRLMLLNRRRMETLRQRLCRRKKMIDSGQQCNETDREEELCDPEKFLEVILKE